MNHTYGQLPTVVSHDNRVSDFQCRLYAEIASLSNKYGYCFASNDYLGKTFSKSPETISRAISGLQKLGYLTVVIEDGYKRKMKVKMDFSDMEPIDENVKGGCQKDQGGLSKMSRGVDENVMTANNIIQLNKSNEIIEEPQKEISIQVNEEFEGMKLIVHDTIPSTQEQTPTSNSAAPPSPRKAKTPKYIYPPTIEELVQPIYEKLIEKKRIHPNIVDCWNWANHQAEAFWLYHDKTGWKVEKLGGAIATWINKAIQYKTVVVPCPIQYKGNPANAQPAPTKVHVKETKSPEQSKEARKAMFAAAKAELNQIGA